MTRRRRDDGIIAGRKAYVAPKPNPRADVICAQCSRHFKGITAGSELIAHVIRYAQTGEHA